MLLKTTYSMLTFTNPSHFFSWENYRIGWAGGDNVPKGSLNDFGKRVFSI